jgi:hypothetical protein
MPTEMIKEAVSSLERAGWVRADTDKSFSHLFVIEERIEFDDTMHIREGYAQGTSHLGGNSFRKPSINLLGFVQGR